MHEIHSKDQNLDYSGIKGELKKQDMWIRNLYTHSQNLHSYVANIKETSTSHKKELLERVGQITEWVDYLHKSQLELKRDIRAFRGEMVALLKKNLEEYHNLMAQYLSLKHNELIEKDAELKKEIMEEMAAELKKYFSVHSQIQGTGKQPPEPLVNITLSEKAELSNPEKQILSLLFNEAKPMTYGHISKRLGKSLSTIRVYMNSLKAKRPIIEEFSAPGGSKVFSIKNSEMVKTLFNIQD